MSDESIFLLDVTSDFLAADVVDLKVLLYMCESCTMSARIYRKYLYNFISLNYSG